MPLVQNSSMTQGMPCTRGHVHAGRHKRSCRVQVQGMTVRGVIRIIPIPAQNLLAFSFAAPPSIDLSMDVQLHCFSKQLGRFGMLKTQLANALYNGLTEPRRRIIPLFPHMAHAINPRELATATLAVTVTRVNLPVDAESELVLCAEVRKVCSTLRSAFSEDRRRLVPCSCVDGIAVWPW